MLEGCEDNGVVTQSGGLSSPIQQSFGPAGSYTNSEGHIRYSQPIGSCGTTNVSDLIKPGVRYHSNQNSSKPQHTRNYSSGSCEYNPHVNHASHLVSPLATTVPVRRHSGSETPKSTPVYSVPLVQTAPSQNDVIQAKLLSVRSLPFDPTGLQHVRDSRPQSRKSFTHRRALSGPVSYRFLSSFQQMPSNAANGLLTHSNNSVPQQSFESSTTHNDRHRSVSRNPSNTSSTNSDTGAFHSVKSELSGNVNRYNSIPSSTDSFPTFVSKQLSPGTSRFIQKHSDSQCSPGPLRHYDKSSSTVHVQQPLEYGVVSNQCVPEPKSDDLKFSTSSSSSINRFEKHSHFGSKQNAEVQIEHRRKSSYASDLWNVDVQLAANSSSPYKSQPINPVSPQQKDSDTPVIQIHVDPISSPIVSPPSGSASPCQFHRMGHSRHLSLGRSIPQPKLNHSRNHSLGSINVDHVFPSSSLNSRQSSVSNLSMCSNLSSVSGFSAKSANSNFLNESQLSKFPDPEHGYDFAQHFNLFSQYTSNMALLYCSSNQRTSQHSSVPTVWCMDVWKSVVAVGCGNGQIEVKVCITNGHRSLFTYRVHMFLSRLGISLRAL